MSALLDRYRRGDHVAVWEELVALGKKVRRKEHYAEAVEIANETMRRARHNVELLVQRLTAMNYSFLSPSDEYLLASLRRTTTHNDRSAKLKAELEVRIARLQNTPPLQNPDVFDPPGEQTEADLKKLEEEAGGPFPISLRAWYQEVGGVSLVGSHEVINPKECETADPLVVARSSDLLRMLEFGESNRGLPLWIAPDSLHKANISGGEPYTITIPNATADAPFEYEWHETTFVNYLRKAFEWGGFPGWERSKAAPLEAIAKLKEGFLPL